MCGVVELGNFKVKHKMAKKETASKKKQESCFVIMPFSGWFNSYYVEIYCPAIREAGLIPIRADDLYRPSNIVDDIWESTRNAKVILADLTGKNPNVFYELGLAHALTKPAILITQEMEDIPFDLRSLRIIEYDRNLHNWGDMLKEKIIKAIEECIEDPDRAIPTTFMEVKKNSSGERSEADVAFMQLSREVDSIKREIRTIQPSNSTNLSGIMSSAEQIIRNELKKGSSREEIKSRLLEHNISDAWIDKRIDKILSLE